MEKNIFDELNELLESKNYPSFMRKADELPPADAAEYLSSLPPERQPAVFRLLKKDTAADVFAELDNDLQENIVTRMTDSEIAYLIEDLYTDDAVDMLEELPAGVVNKILRLAKPGTRADINKIMNYPDDSAASIMTSEFIDIKIPMTVADAVNHIRSTGLDKETVYVAYVTDSGRHLIGIVELRELLFASPDAQISDIMDSNVISASTVTDKEETAKIISKYDLLALPIVDGENRLVGIVTVDDAIDVIKAETTEDISKMAAITPSEKPYLKVGVFSTWKARIPWLLLLMVSATITGLIITKFESALASLVVLTAFIPMLMDTGGNSGSQASVTVIRALSLGEVTFKDTLRVVWKEIRVALLCGATLALACFAKICLFDMLILRTEGLTFLVAAVVSLTLCVTVLCAKLIGSFLPLIATKIGLDPALVASPVITTVVDMVSLLVYFGIATALLGI